MKFRFSVKKILFTLVLLWTKWNEIHFSLDLWIYYLCFYKISACAEVSFPMISLVFQLVFKINFKILFIISRKPWLNETNSINRSSLLEVLCEKEKLWKILKKTPVPEALFHKFAGCGFVAFSKRDSGTEIFLWIFFWEQPFYRTPVIESLRICVFKHKFGKIQSRS